MGNCFAGRSAGQFQLGSCATDTPQRIRSRFATTIDCTPKSSPFGSLALWHETQYVAKKAAPHEAHVSVSGPSGAHAGPESRAGAPGDPPGAELDEHPPAPAPHAAASARTMTAQPDDEDAHRIAGAW